MLNKAIDSCGTLERRFPTCCQTITTEHWLNWQKKDGIGLYGESAGISLPILQDALRNKSFLDIPMSEFGMTQGLGSAGNWMSPHDLEQKRGFRSASDRLNAHQSDVREAASAAHIFGKKFVAAESWTGGAYEAPSDMKLIGDYWATQGINRFVFHTSTHQPLDTKPGNSMVGTHMHRNITWAEQAKPFVDYLSRTSYLLQQGQFVGDILLYLGEAIPSAVPYWKRTHPEIPRGYDYDYINTDVLINALTVKEGKLVLPTGASYEVLVLPADTQMNVTNLRKVKELIVQGATVVGPQPTQAATLHEFPMADAEILALAKEVWGGVDGKMIFHRKLGKGQVYTSVSLDAVLSAKGVQPDLAYTQPHLDTYLSWIHRRANENDIYFLVNMRKQQEKLVVTFRVTDRVPEIWNPDSGSTYPVTYRTTELGIEVLLDLQPEESLFVVFRKSSSQKEYQAKSQTTTVIASVVEPWSLSFPDGWGAPPTVTLSKLISWTDHSNEGGKYFSGTAEYRTTFTIPKNTKLGESLRLDLGEVHDLAEVTLNGKVLETRWKSPFVWDVSGLVKSGTNELRVRVTNQWTNRIAGDVVDPETKVLSGAGFAFGRPSTTTKPAGILGPVKLLMVH